MWICGIIFWYLFGFLSPLSMEVFFLFFFFHSFLYSLSSRFHLLRFWTLNSNWVSGFLSQFCCDLLSGSTLSTPKDFIWVFACFSPFLFSDSFYFLCICNELPELDGGATASRLQVPPKRWGACVGLLGQKGGRQWQLEFFRVSDHHRGWLEQDGALGPSRSDTLSLSPSLPLSLSTCTAQHSKVCTVVNLCFSDVWSVPDEECYVGLFAT